MLSRVHMLALVAVLALSTAALAGGFWITTHSANAPLAAKIADAAVLVEVGGCANPADAKLTGTAEGIVNGKRQSVALQFVPTSNPKVFVVKKTWPAQGAWVLAITGMYSGHDSNQFVELGSNGKYRAQAISKAEITAKVDAALRVAAAKAT